MKVSPEVAARCLELAGEPTKPKRKKNRPWAPKPVPASHGTELKVTLPVPPSANNLFATVKNRRVKTQEYRDWIAANVLKAKTLQSPPSYPCVGFYLLTGDVNPQRDGFNCEKALSDLFVRAGVIPDDSLKYLTGGCWHFLPTAEPPEVVIWFTAAGIWNEARGIRRRV